MTKLLFVWVDCWVDILIKAFHFKTQLSSCIFLWSDRIRNMIALVLYRNQNSLWWIKEYITHTNRGINLKFSFEIEVQVTATSKYHVCDVKDLLFSPQKRFVEILSNDKSGEKIYIVFPELVFRWMNKSFLSSTKALSIQCLELYLHTEIQMC